MPSLEARKSSRKVHTENPLLIFLSFCSYASADVDGQVRQVRAVLDFCVFMFVENRV